MAGQSGAFSALSNRTYRALLIAGMMSTGGGMIQLTGAAWLMTELTSSHLLVAMVQSSLGLPTMALALAIGVLADSFDRRKLILIANTLMMVTTLAIAALAFSGLLTPWLLLGLSLLVGSGSALHFPSWQVSTSDVVGRDSLASAVAMNAAGFNVTRSIAPAMGGAVQALIGPASVFGLAAGCFGVTLGIVARWRPERPANALPREAFGAAYWTALRYLAISPGLMTIIGRSFLLAFLGISVQALLPVVVRDVYGAEAYAYGALLGCIGLGAVFGALVSGGIRARFANETLVRSGTLALAGTVALVAWSPNVFVAAPVLMALGSIWVVLFSLLNSSTQLSSPRWIGGRTLSLYHTCTFGGIALGSLLWGAVAEQGGTAFALYVSAGSLVLIGGLGLLPNLPSETSSDLTPANRFTAPEVDLDDQSGPITIRVEHVIAPEDTKAFLDLMSHFRRVRIRNGARRWALGRDLADPEIWVESYQTSTWTEYLRHHARQTNADADILDRIKALQKGGRPLRTRRFIERSINANRRPTERTPVAPMGER